MEVTPEMIETVDAYRKSLAVREAEQYRREYQARQYEKERRLKVGAMAQVQMIVAVTEDEFDTLHDIFREYLHEVEDW